MKNETIEGAVMKQDTRIMLGISLNADIARMMTGGFENNELDLVLATYAKIAEKRNKDEVKALKARNAVLREKNVDLMEKQGKMMIEMSDLRARNAALREHNETYARIVEERKDADTNETNSPT